MSLWPRSRFGLGISSTDVALAAVPIGGNSIEIRSEPLTVTGQHVGLRTQSNTLDNLSVALARLLSRLDLSVSACSRVVVTDDLARYVIVSPPDGVGSMRELQAVTDARFRAIFGVTSERWRVCGDWQSTGPFVCSSVPEHLIDIVRSVLPPRLYNIAIEPLFTVITERVTQSIPTKGCLCIKLTGYLLMTIFNESVVLSLRVLKTSEENIMEFAEAQLRRESSRLGLPATFPMLWFDAKCPINTNRPHPARHGVAYQPVFLKQHENTIPEHALSSNAGLAAWLSVT